MKRAVNVSELPNHHKSISKIRHFTLFILIYSTLLYGCCVFIYCMCVIRPTFECIHIVDIKQSRLCLSVTSIIHTFTHTGESGTDGIAAITIINYVQTLKAYIVYRLWYRLGSVGFCSNWIHVRQIRFYAQILGTKRQDSGIIFT